MSTKSFIVYCRHSKSLLVLENEELKLSCKIRKVPICIYEMDGVEFNDDSFDIYSLFEELLLINGEKVLVIKENQITLAIDRIETGRTKKAYFRVYL